MARSIFLANNQVPEGALSLSAGTVNSQFPLTNIQTDATTNTSRVGPDSSGSVKLVLQMPQDMSVNTVAIVGSNLDGIGYTNLSIKTSLTSDFSTATAIPVVLSQKYNYGYTFFTAALARFVEFEFTNTGAFIDISKLYIGTRTEISASYQRTDFARELIRNDEIQENILGNRFVNILNSRDRLSGTYPLLESENFLTIEDLFVRHGSYEPIWVMIDADNNLFTDGEFKLSGYFYFNNMFSHDLVGGGYFNVAIELLEVV